MLRTGGSIYHRMQEAEKIINFLKIFFTPIHYIRGRGYNPISKLPVVGTWAIPHSERHTSPTIHHREQTAMLEDLPL